MASIDFSSAGGIERHGVGTIIASIVNSIVKYNLRSVEYVAAVCVVLGYHLELGLRTANEIVERRVAEFADVPYQNPLSRQQWEDLWEE